MPTHNPFSDTTLLRMVIHNIRESGFLHTALDYWVLKSTLATFTQFKTAMIASDAYCQETDTIISSPGYSVNLANRRILNNVSEIPSLASTTTSEISAALSDITKATATQTAQLNVMMAAMMNYHIPPPADPIISPELGTGRRYHLPTQCVEDQVSY